MGHHTDSGCCATPWAIKIAPDSFTIDLLFGGVVVIHLMRQDTPSESLIQWGRNAALLSVNMVLADSNRVHSSAFAEL